MTTNVRAKTRKKRKSKETTFHLTDLSFYTNLTKWSIPYVKSAFYKGKRLKRLTYSSRYIYKINNYIIKIELEAKDQTENEIRFYDRIQKKDSKYFPQLVAGDAKKGIVVQEYIPFKKGCRSKQNRAIIRKLVERYQIRSDVHSQYDFNWAINKRTNLPVIFDLGFA